MYSSPDEDILILRKRKGLIRLAAAHGSSLVPVFCFNENDVYDQFSVEHKFVRTMKEQFQKVFGISLPFPKNIIPKAAKITCVYGTPIKVAKNLQPTEQFISSYQMQYIETVEELYKEYGPKYNSKLKKLIIK